MPVRPISPSILSAGEIRGFNPQPEPPREVYDLSLDRGSITGFNPQPEPPRVALPAGVGAHSQDIPSIGADTMSEWQL